MEWKGEDEEDGDGEADSGDEKSKTTEDEASASGSVDSVKRSPFLSFTVPAMPSYVTVVMLLPRLRRRDVCRSNHHCTESRHWRT